MHSYFASTDKSLFPNFLYIVSTSEGFQMPSPKLAPHSRYAEILWGRGCRGPSVSVEEGFGHRSGSHGRIPCRRGLLLNAIAGGG